jgi:hypothetical protein
MVFILLCNTFIWCTVICAFLTIYAAPEDLNPSIKIYLAKAAKRDILMNLYGFVKKKSSLLDHR